jgi:hypothetical protein
VAYYSYTTSGLSVQTGTSSDSADLAVVSPKRTAVRIRATAGWLDLSPIVGYYSTNQHPAGTSINIPQATHGLRGVRGLMVTVHNDTTGAQEVADVTVTTGGAVTVTFVSPAAANAKRITIMGPVL